MESDWKDNLKQLGMGRLDENFKSIPLVVVELFKGVITPEVTISEGSKIDVPDNCTIKIGGGSRLYSILKNVSVFDVLPDGIKESMLDVLYLILRNGTYDVARFRCFRERGNGKGNASFVRIILTLLRHNLSTDNVNISIARRLVRLLGVICAAGICASDLKHILKLLRKPSEISIHLLQSLKFMIKQDDGVVKASPTSFFNFGGYKAGLYVTNTTYPFSREYQITFWFRVENFNINSSPNVTSTSNIIRHTKYQHLFTCLNAQYYGIDIYLNDKILCLEISESKSECTNIKLNQFAIRRNVWYHFSMKHIKPRLSLFARDELTVNIDHEIIYHNSIRFPSASALGEITEFSCGKNFDGQLGPVYVLSEALLPGAIEIISKLHAGKVADGQSASTSGSASVDLLQTVAAVDKKVLPFSPKLIAVYHPNRCVHRHALDVHGGRHGRFGRVTFPWTVVGVRDVLAALGGVSCLLPLFPRLLIEHDYFAKRNNVSGSTGSSNNAYGSSSGDNTGDNLDPDRFDDDDDDYEEDDDVVSRSNPRAPPLSAVTWSSSAWNVNDNGTRRPHDHDNDHHYVKSISHETTKSSSVYLSKASLRTLAADAPEHSEEGIVGLLLSLLARCIRSHKSNQKELLRVCGIEMIEYAISCTPNELLRLEGESCVLALLQLRLAAKDSPQLENNITKHLLCNFKIWSRSSFQLQSSLMSVILAAVRAQPDYFVNAVGVQFLLDCLLLYNLEFNDDGDNSGGNNNNTSRSELSIVIPTSPLLKSQSPRVDDSSTNPSPTTTTGSGTVKKGSAGNLKENSVKDTNSSSGGDGGSGGSGDNGMKASKDDMRTKDNSTGSGGNGNSGYRKRLSPHIEIEDSNNNSSNDNDNDDDDNNEGGGGGGGIAVMKSEPTIRKILGDGGSSSSYNGNNRLTPPVTPTTMRRLSFIETVRRQATVKSFVGSHDEDDDDEDDNESVETVTSTNLNVTLSVKDRRKDVSDDVQNKNRNIKTTSTIMTERSSYDATSDTTVSATISKDTDRDMDLKLQLPSIATDTYPVLVDAEVEVVRNCCLSDEEKAHIRSSIQSVLIVMVQFSLSTRDVTPLVDFLAINREPTVLNEIGQVLLCLLIECGVKVATIITECCRGPEEFAAFILCYLINRVEESVRCTGVRLLTHYYLHTEAMPVYLLNMTLKNRKGGILARVRERLSNMTLKGIERLGACGGLSLLSLLLLKNKNSSADMTYTSLLEMLLTSPSSIGQMSVQHRGMYEDSSTISSISAQTLQGRSGRRSSFSFSGTVGDSVYSSSISNNNNSINVNNNNVNIKMITDEVLLLTNPVVLSVFLDTLPSLPRTVMKRVYGDLLAIINHSSINRDVFCSHPKWHICLNELIGQIIGGEDNGNGSSNGSGNGNGAIAGQAMVRLSDISTLLDRHLSQGLGYCTITNSNSNNTRAMQTLTNIRSAERAEKDTGQLLRKWGSNNNNSSSKKHDDSSGSITSIIGEDWRAVSRDNDRETMKAYENNNNNENDKDASSNIDIWFDIGMKIYATALLHSMDSKGGWRELEKTFAHCQSSPQGMAICKAVFSQLFHELTFTMRAKYRELQKQARSTNTDETTEAAAKLENMMVLIVSGSLFLLETQSIAVLGMPGMQLGRQRLSVMNEIRTEEAANGQAACLVVCNDNTHHICEESVDLCFQCGHSLSLHHTDPHIMEIVENRLHDYIARDEEAQAELKSILNDSNVGDVEDDFSLSSDNEHVWVEVTPDTLSYFDYLLNSIDNSSDGTDTGNTTTAAAATDPAYATRKRSSLSADGLGFGPIRRCSDRPRAKMIILLQALRFFDLIFWPKEAEQLRNLHLMRFQRDHAFTGLDNNAKNNNNTTPGKMSSSSPMSVYSGSVRMCLTLLHGLSPLETAAELNLKRLLRLVQSHSKLCPFSSPLTDWLRVIALHTLIALKRLKVALKPLLSLFAISNKSYTSTSKSKSSSSSHDVVLDVLSKLDWEGNMRRVMSDVTLTNAVEILLNNSIGKVLLRHIGNALSILDEAYKAEPVVLQEAFGDTFRCLCSDRRAYFDRVGVGAVPVSSRETDKSNTTTTTTSSSSNNNTTSINSPLDIQLSPPLLPVAYINNKDLLRDLSQGDINDEDIAGNITPSLTNNINNNNNSTSVRSVRLDSVTSDDSERQRAATMNSPPEMSSTSSSSNFGIEAVQILSWLCHPFTSYDPMKNEHVLVSVTKLEKFEMDSAVSFMKVLSTSKQNMDEQRDIDTKLANEMVELQDLGKSVRTMITEREASRMTVKGTEEDATTRLAARSWESCLRYFDSDWSPWISDDIERKNEVQYRLSSHRDSRMRRMLLIRSVERKDYSEAAHMKGRGVGAITPRGEGGGDSDSSPSTLGGALSTTSAHAFLQDALKIIRPKQQQQQPQRVETDDAEDCRQESSSATSDQFVTDKPMGGIFSGNTGKRPVWTLGFEWSADEKEVLRFIAMKIDMEKDVTGILLLTNKHLYYHPKKWTGGLSGKDEPLKDKRWRLDRLVEAYGRRHLLQNSAIELFFADNHEVFFAFQHSSELNRFFQSLLRQNTPLLITPSSLNPKYVFSHSDWTELWRRRLISNFEYLMRLNIIAGRSYNDITQYPVFPWVLEDYISETLNLSNSEVFRDLSKPMGALNESRLAEMMERYRTFDDPEVPKFMYGTHYSSAGVVLQYLIRLEPFTTLGVNLQGGRFDCPDRLFFDIGSTWEGCNCSISDVKELIPELFCCPEILINSSNLPLGELQDNNGQVGDVRLPPWAKNSPFEFIRLNREALESDYVSSNLHNWIDLIFGYKQTGKAAIDAHNVFYYLTYENSIDIEAIEDPLQKEAAKQQVIHFGQTPSQLTSKEHPRRLPKDECMTSLCSDIAGLSKLKIFTPSKQYGLPNVHNLGPVTSMRCSSDRLVVFHSDQTVCQYRWSSFPDGENNPFQIKPEKFKSLPSMALSMSKESMSKRGFVSTFRDKERDRDITHTSSLLQSASSSTNSPNRQKSIRLPLPLPPTLHQQQQQQQHLTTDNHLKSSLSSFGGGIGGVASAEGDVDGYGDRGDGDGDYEEVTAPSHKHETTEEEKPSFFGGMSLFGAFKGKGKTTTTTTTTAQVQVQRSASNSIPSMVTNVSIGNDSNKADWKYYNDSDDDAASSDMLSVNEDHDVIRQTKSSDWTDFSRDTTFNDDDERQSVTDSCVLDYDDHTPVTPYNTASSADSSNEPDDVLVVGSACVALSVGDLGQGRVVSCGYWDNTVKVHALDSLKELASVSGGHLGPITCLQLGADSHTLITGGADGTCRVWVLEDASIASAMSEESSLPIDDDSDPTLVCVHILCGHDSPVRAISYSHDHDLLLSGSQSGTLCVHTIRKGNCIRTISDLEGITADVLLLTSPGYLVVHSWTDLSLHLFWLNGQHKLRIEVPVRIECLAVNGTGNVLVCGLSDGRLSLRTLWDLQEQHVLDVTAHGAIRFLRFTEDVQFLLVGSEDGTMSICTDPDVRFRMLKLALQKMPLLGPQMS